MNRFDAIDLAVLMMLSLIAWHFIWEMIDYTEQRPVINENRPASLQHDRGAGPARTGQGVRSISSADRASDEASP